MSRLIDENDIIKMLNTMDRYTSEELTLCDTDKTFPMNEVFIVDDVFEGLDELPSAQPDSKELSPTHKSLDTVGRQAAIDAVDKYDFDFPQYMERFVTELRDAMKADLKADIKDLPSVQPEQHTCVNCGRTANNGGWYADGRTRCPIEEHYALPKDGYCHLWEKRNVTDDDYPERREE